MADRRLHLVRVPSTTSIRRAVRHRPAATAGRPWRPDPGRCTAPAARRPWPPTIQGRRSPSGLGRSTTGRRRESGSPGPRGLLDDVAQPTKARTKRAHPRPHRFGLAVERLGNQARQLRHVRRPHAQPHDLGHAQPQAVDITLDRRDRQADAAAQQARLREPARWPPPQRCASTASWCESLKPRALANTGRPCASSACARACAVAFIAAA